MKEFRLHFSKKQKKEIKKKQSVAKKKRKINKLKFQCNKSLKHLLIDDESTDTEDEELDMYILLFDEYESITFNLST
jgi:DNA-binding protein YbaB